MTKPAIVISAFNRPISLKRLLSYLSKAKYPCQDIPLIISIDGDGDSSVKEIAESFYWGNGNKTIIKHENNLGLKKHIISCGDLSLEYGSIILLEDDLVVGPGFYNYALQAINEYASNPKIAGISLYLYRFNENASFFPFIPFENGLDAFFLQVPCSWGQAWTSEQWGKFIEYYTAHPTIPNDNQLPLNVFLWPESSWKKHFYNYMLTKDLYFIYPYLSHTSNWGDVGTHFGENTSIFRVPLSLLTEKKYQFPVFSKKSVIYDVFFEISPDFLKEHGIYPDCDFGVDLLGTKDLSKYNNSFFISTKTCNDPIDQFGTEMIPLEQNVILKNVGSGISFAEKRTFCLKGDDGTLDRIAAQYFNCIFNYGYWLGFVDGERKKNETTSYKVGRLVSSPYRFLKKVLEKR